MFICDSCLTKLYLNKPSFLMPLSRGPCEICSTVSICYDIPSRYLIRRGENKTCSNCHRSMVSIAGYDYIVCGIRFRKGAILKVAVGCGEWKEAPEGWGENK